MQGVSSTLYTVFDFSFVGGALEIIAAAHFPAIDDTLPELTEGFLYYLVVVNKTVVRSREVVASRR